MTSRPRRRASPLRTCNPRPPGGKGADDDRHPRPAPVSSGVAAASHPVDRSLSRMSDLTEMGAMAGEDGRRRCPWAGTTAEYQTYHDDEWGRPVVDDVRIYEKLCLEGFQSGLSWLTLLRKGEGFGRALVGLE